MESSYDKAMHYNRVKFLEKQNEALLKALMKKTDTDPLLKMLIEQQRQILELGAKVGSLMERDVLRERQVQYLLKK